ERAGFANQQTAGQTLQVVQIFHQHSFKPKGMLMARPPSAVSLYLWFISTAVSHMVFTTASKETFAKSGVLCRASCEAVMAFMAPMVFLSMQGTCTSPAIGSQVRPR